MNNDPEALLSKAKQLLAGEKAAEALPLLQHAVQLKPNWPDALTELGVALFLVNRDTDALQPLRSAVRLNPRLARANKALGATLSRLNEIEQGVPYLQTAADLQPNDFEAQSNLAVALYGLRRLDEMAAPLQRAIELNPNAAEARYLRAAYWLLLGDFERGWPEYEWRWQSATRPYPKPQLPGPEWNGQPISGKRLFVYPEQGFGDTIQFSRYVPILSERGITPVFVGPPELLDLLGTLPGNFELRPLNGRVNYDLHCSLLSLPRLLNTRLETVPASVPYLRADPARVSQWKSRLQGVGRHGMKIGIAWAGDARHPNDRARSCRLLDFAPLSAVEADFFSLQKGPAAGQTPPDGLVVYDLMDEVRTFADGAAFISNLDLVIAVDTAIVHLAGALAKSCWVLLPHAADWRWLHQRTDSPWYPTLRLFRQSKIGDWPGVFGEVVAALNGTSRKNKGT
jgi:hypothetical protein